jgi:hypothetical protein
MHLPPIANYQDCEGGRTIAGIDETFVAIQETNSDETPSEYCLIAVAAGRLLFMAKTTLRTRTRICVRDQQEQHDALYLTCPHHARNNTVCFHLEREPDGVYGVCMFGSNPAWPIPEVNTALFDRLFERADKPFAGTSNPHVGDVGLLPYACLPEQHGRVEHVSTVGTLAQVLEWSWDSGDGSGPRYTVTCERCGQRSGWVAAYDAHQLRLWSRCGHTWVQSLAHDELDYAVAMVKESRRVRGEPETQAAAWALIDSSRLIEETRE